MTITFRDYTMEASSDGGFNLTKKVTREKGNIRGKQGTGEHYEDEQLIGYNMTLESCVKKIIHINHCSKEDKLSLKEYIDMYKEEVKKIEQLLKYR